MNLILPLREQLPVKKDFIKLFFDKSGDFYSVKKDKIKDLKEKFKGRVSYLKAVTSEIQKTFEGQKVQNLKYFTTFPLIMKDKQSEIYKEVIVKDSKQFTNVNIEDLSTEIDDDDVEFEVKSQTTRGLVSAFSKYTGNRLNNRVVLNRFIGMIA